MGHKPMAEKKSDSTELKSDKKAEHPHLLQPAQEALVNSTSRLTQRRHTRHQLYTEGLKRSSNKRTPTATASMSKSLGELPSDDISCTFDSKYCSISCSFTVRPTQDQLYKRSSQKSVSDLTEQLQKLTDVKPLTVSDSAPQNRPRKLLEEPVDETLVHRTSSRSQSRVRYIADWAKKAQERVKVQSLVQGRNASFSLTGSIGSGSSVSPIEERGIPEGMCCVTRSPCSSLDLLTQHAPFGSPSLIQSQPFHDPENSEVFFLLKL